MSANSFITLLVIFFASGFAGLVYEILWIREFSFILGNSVYTISTVLAAYMAGLALGSRLAGKFAARLSRPLLLYSALEAGIGLAGLIIYRMFHSVVKDLGPIGVINGATIIPFLQRFGISFAILVVPTALMGATLPMLARQADRGGEKSGMITGLLYGVNTLGAAVGCFVTGFFLIRLLGTEQTNNVAVGLNLGVALLALILAMFSRESPPSPSGDLTPEIPAEPEIEMAVVRRAVVHPAGFSAGTAQFMLFAILVSGMTSMAYELLYFRLLSYFVGNRVYASTTMITVFLLGMGAGSAVAGKIVDRLRNEVSIFSALQVITGIFAVSMAVYFPDVLDFIRYRESLLKMSEPWQFAAVRIFETAAILGIPALAFGAMFPCAIRYLNRGPGGISSATGRVYAWNTAGCIIGSLGTGFILIPLLGTFNTMVLAASVSLLLGHRIFIPRWEGAGMTRQAAVLTISALLTVIAAGWALVNRNYPWDRPGLKRIFTQEEPSALITAYTGPLGFYLFGDDTELSFPIGHATGAVIVQKLQAHIPLLLHPDPKRVLVIGLGFGITTGSFAQYGGLESVETVELFPGGIKAAPLFNVFSKILAPTVPSRIIAGDGRYYLRHAPHDYDIITSNVTSPDLPGSSSCYTREYFELVRSRLAPGGIFLVHVFGKERKTVYRTLAEVFPHIIGFKAYTHSHHLIASLTQVKIDRKEVERKLAKWRPFRMDARESGLASADALVKRFTMTEADFRAEISVPGLPINTDSRPILEYRLADGGADPFYSRMSVVIPTAGNFAIISAVGDILLYNRAAGAVLENAMKSRPRDPFYIYQYPFEGVRSELRGIVVGNLEGPLTDQPIIPFPDKNEPFYFAQPRRFVEALKQGGFDVMTLANNHIKDCGPRGVMDTVATLARAGIAPVGAGENAAEAGNPHIFKENGIRIAFFAWNLVPPESVWAGPETSGAAHATPREMIAAIRAVRQRCEAVVISLHWGREKWDESDLHPLPAQRKLAHDLVDAGASVILGSHSHAFEEYERYRAGVIFYSLGNFVFTGTAGNAHQRSAIARITIDGIGDVTRVQVVPVDITPGRARYRPVPIEQKKR